MAKHIAPDDHLSKILSDWFGAEWIDLTDSNKECVIAEIKRALKIGNK